jgi:type I restriction enzyme S subunit
VLTANKSFILGFTDENFGICFNVPVIIFDDFTTESKYVDFPFKVKSSAIKILRQRNNECNLKFIYELMQTIKYPIGDHKRYYITEYQNIEIFVPTLKEQQAIAEVLSDIDTIIDKLDKLIQKKINIKNATMHLLLSGKKRLPGFKGDWVRKKIKDLLQYERPDKYIVKSEEYYQHGRTPVLTANKSFLLGFTDENFGIYYNIPVIIFDDFTTESKYVDFPFKVKSSAIKILRQRNNECNLKFIYELMQMIKYPIGDHKRYYITEYQNIEVLVPAIKEQQAIAQVLFDMDKEIDALQKRKNKLTHIKQAAMNLLLTGKVRLIHPSQNSTKTKHVSQNTTHA